MNKHLKPGVAVDVRGASDEDVQAVIGACVALGAMRGTDVDSRYVKWCPEGAVWLSGNSGQYNRLTISQALGRESEVENTWFERGELPPVGAKVQYQAKATDSHVAIVSYCWYAGTIIAYHDGAVWTSDNGIRQLDNTVFRPLKTEKEKFVERARELEVDGKESVSEYIRRLFDNGARFVDIKA